MMMKVVFVSCAFVVALAGNAAAEIVQIPLPELSGSYPASRTVTIQLRDEPLIIRGATIRLVGEATVGSYFCGPNGPYPLPLLFSARFLDTPGGFWCAGGSTSAQPGSFEIISQFSPLQDPTWEFLMDGEGEVNVTGDTGFLPGGCWEVAPPEATVSEAVLYVDADFPVPAESNTWGRIKALYE